MSSKSNSTSAGLQVKPRMEEEELPIWLREATIKSNEEVDKVIDEEKMKLFERLGVENPLLITIDSKPFVNLERCYRIGVIDYSFDVCVYSYQPVVWEPVDAKTNFSDLSMILADKIAEVLHGKVETYRSKVGYHLVVTVQYPDNTYYITITQKGKVI